ncbi:unnamed protein product [Rotaria sp. Silwood1]|nr:unnamed protein product [Rotaria sp. Silwood1]
MAFAQFRILFKKNFLLRRRQPVLFLFELLWPLLLFCIVAIVRKTSPTQNRPACYYNPMPLPNSGTIGFLQSFLCNTNVSCRLKPFDVQTSSLRNYFPSVYDGILGLTQTEGVNTVLNNLPNLTRSVDHINNAFNDTFLLKILDGQFHIYDLFNNTNELKNVLLLTGMPNDLIDHFLNGSFNLTEIYDTFNKTINIEPFCRNDFLNHLLTVDNLTNPDIVIQALCQLNIRNLTMDINTFINQLNYNTINKYFENISQLINGPELRDKIQQLRNLENIIKELSSYADLIKNMPNMTEMARIIPRLVQIIELVQNQRDLIQLSMSSSIKPAWCSKLPRSQYSLLDRVSISSQQWFQVYRVRPNVFAIYEPYHWEETISYLVIGSKHSLLIDTGMGIGNIQQVIQSLIPSTTSLKMINTHTHHDHIGDNWRFSGKILGVRSDFTEYNAQGTIEEAQNELKPGMIWEKYLPEDFNPKDYRIRPFQINTYVKEDDRIDLGQGQELQIISTPGHSPDSISILNEKERLLFAGDVFYQGPILLYRPETNLQDYLISLEKLAKISTKFDLVLPGHNIPNVESKLIMKAAKAMQEIMNGKLIPKKTDDGKYDEYSFGEFSFVIDRSFLLSTLNKNKEIF